MSKLARLPIDTTADIQVDNQNQKQIEKSVSQLIREGNEKEAQKLFLKNRLEDEIRTELDKFARELSQARKLRQK